MGKSVLTVPVMSNIQFQLCYKYHDIVSRLVRNIQDRIKDEKEFISLHRESPQSSHVETPARDQPRPSSAATSKNREKRQQVLKAMIDR